MTLKPNNSHYHHAWSSESCWILHHCCAANAQLPRNHSCIGYLVSVLNRVDVIASASPLNIYFIIAIIKNWSSSLRTFSAIMNAVLLCALSSIIFGVNGFPQSASELAIATKLTEQIYYSKDVKSSLTATLSHKLNWFSHPCRLITWFRLIIQRTLITRRKSMKAMGPRSTPSMMGCTRKLRASLMWILT